MTKFFWLLSDKKTIREISFEAYSEVARKQWNLERNAKMLCVLHDNEVYLRKGKRSFWIPRQQLAEILTK